MNVVLENKNNKSYAKGGKKQRLSPKSFFDKYVFDSIPQHKSKKKKIDHDDFKVLNYNDYDNLLKINYNVKQLKEICRNYKLKISGTKHELLYRTYNYLKYSYYSIKVQKIFRGYLRRKLNILRGPSNFNRKCVNETDFLTLNNVKDIPYNQFFSFKDTDGFIYGFNVKSLYNMFKNNGSKNPYNRKKFPDNLYDLLIKIIKLSKVLNESIDIEIKDEIEKMSMEKKIQLKTTSIFQKIDVHGFTSDTNWFLDLNRVQLIRYVKELIDIWEYRTNLPFEAKKNICPPNGRPFYNTNFMNINVNNNDKLKLTILNIINIFVDSGVTHNDKSLGTYYVLGAFTIVSQSARNALPWMYESFMLNNN